MKTNQGMREVCLSIALGQPIQWGETTIDKCLEANLIAYDTVSKAYALTGCGELVANAELLRRAAVRQKKNLQARARNSVLRDLGMRRTAHGWE